MASFTGKVAVVTGGNSGIGLATAQELRAQGAQVVISGRDERTLNSAAQSLGGNTLAVRADVSNLGDLDRLFALTKERFGKIDALFVNAGIAKFAPLGDTIEALFDETIAINFKGAFFTVQKALPLLSNPSAVLFNTTALIEVGMPGTSFYTATKAALRSLTRVFAAELVGRGVRVNAVAPGPIETPIYGRLKMPADALNSMATAITQQVPMKRFGKPADIAQAAAFLLSDAAGYITGVELTVDGGMTQV